MNEAVYLLKPGEMGRLGVGKSIFLSEEVLRNYLRVRPSDAEKDIGKMTKVLCPFCEKGVLKLVSVVPEYSISLPQMYHVGNSYTYECSKECGGIFSGSFNNIWIRSD